MPLPILSMINNLLSEALNELFSLLADPLVQRTDRMRPLSYAFSWLLKSAFQSQQPKT